MNQSISDEGVRGTAPATPGLLKRQESIRVVRHLCKSPQAVVLQSCKMLANSIKSSQLPSFLNVLVSF